MAEYFGSKIEDIFNTMPERFQADGVAGVDVVIGYDISGDGGGKWAVTIKGQTLQVKKIDDELPKCSVTLIADGEAFVGGALGVVELAESMSTGKLKIEGDMTILGNVLPKAFTPFVPIVRATQIINSMVERFRPDKAEGVDMKIGYVLSGEDGGKWTVIIKDGTCTLKDGLDSDCTVVMQMASEVFTGMNIGKIDGATAFSSGQVKVEGDMGAAASSGKYFTRFVVPGAEKRGEELISIKVVNSLDQRFSTGPHMGKWFKGLIEKKFYASKCSNCGRILVPPREGCANCRIRTTEFVEVGPKGTVNVIDTVYYASPDPLTGKVKPTPYATMFLALDNGTPDEIFAFDLRPDQIDRIKVGSRVRPVWNEVRTGSVEDLLYFEIDD